MLCVGHSLLSHFVSVWQRYGATRQGEAVSLHLTSPPSQQAVPQQEKGRWEQARVLREGIRWMCTTFWPQLSKACTSSST